MLAFKFAPLVNRLLLITFSLQLLGSDRVWAETVFSENGVIASRSSLASAVGAEIMEQGGNAIDAAVASGFALAVTYPSAGNLGGGGFMVIRLANGQVVTNDHREKAPILATKDMYLDANAEVIAGLSTRSHLAAGVPGTVAGLIDVLEEFGTMPLSDVIQPAIDLASDGFLIPEDLARQFESRIKDFSPYKASIGVFTKESVPYQAGELFIQSDLSRTLSRIKQLGKKGFYEGETAELIVQEMERGGGLISKEDLQTYESVWRDPIRGTYRGYEIVSMPPPSSGGVLLVQMLNMLEPYDLGTMGFGVSETVHLMIEAQRRAYADRSEYLGDPDFYPVPVEKLINKNYAEERFRDFKPDKAGSSEWTGPGLFSKESLETAHLSVIDDLGNAVAYTTTLNLSYGSKIVVDGAGFLLNNEMDDFSAKENEPNFYGLIGRKANSIEPSKRMLSSMTPTIVLKDGEPLLVTGSPGGSTIITTTLQIILNVIDHGMNLDEAVASPRFHHQWRPDRVIHEESAFSEETTEKLLEIGHRDLNTIPTYYGRGIGDANSVMKLPDGFIGVSDPRNAGGAKGVGVR